MEHWTRATDGFDVRATDKARWFQRLWDMHTEQGRYYHTVVHLEEMFNYFEILRKQNCPCSLTKHEDQAIVLSIFFHDSVYDARSGTNEEDSALLFESFADEWAISKTSETLKSKVIEYILATKKHHVSYENPEPLALFLDLDMAVLGKEEAAYQAYAGLIRKEYEYVPRDIYCQKRGDVLEAFLQHESIYGTDIVGRAFEERARSNIRSEIELLRHGIVPVESNPIHNTL
jgi:predicted metal-dependent HD superfamily phosphohydrolase